METLKFEQRSGWGEGVIHETVFKRGHVWHAGNTARRPVVWAEWVDKEMTHREGRESDHSRLWTTVKISDFTLREGGTQVGVEGVEKKRTWFDFEGINILLWDKNEGGNPYKDRHGTSLVVQWLTIHLPVQGIQVRSLVQELRSHMLWSNKPMCRNYWSPGTLEPVLCSKRNHHSEES